MNSIFKNSENFNKKLLKILKKSKIKIKKMSKKSKQQ